MMRGLYTGFVIVIMLLCGIAIYKSGLVSSAFDALQDNAYHGGGNNVLSE